MEIIQLILFTLALFVALAFLGVLISFLNFCYRKSQWNSTDYLMSEHAVWLTDNQRKLARIAVKAQTWEVRKAAAEKLAAEKHQSLLAGIAATDKHSDVREAAIEKLTGVPEPEEEEAPPFEMFNL